MLLAPPMLFLEAKSRFKLTPPKIIDFKNNIIHGIVSRIFHIIGYLYGEGD
jgi:hypothetical protein